MKKQFVYLFICVLFMAFGCAQNSKDETQTAKAKTYAIGDTGPSSVGIVFYTTDGGAHGLEAAPSLWNGGAADPTSEWISGAVNQSTLIGNTLTAIGTGLENSYAIRIQSGLAGTSAATLCRNYIGGGKTDWFLPSKDELAQLYIQKNIVPGLNFGWGYWSSSEIDASNVWRQTFDLGSQSSWAKSSSAKCRPIRAF